MSVANNICKLNVSDNEDATYWFRYIETATILNAFDTVCDRLNGADFDSDTVYLTDNHILVDNMPNTKTIICLQKQAEKIIPTEKDIIESNKNGFGNQIGAITNRITEMYDLQPLFAPDSAEYKESEYRIMCGQHFQQAEIDSIKGVISKPMPKNWYSINKDMTDFEKSICASKKPYFMIYIYPDLYSKYKKYLSNANSKAVIQFCKPLNLLSEQNASEAEFLYYMNLLSPVSSGNCTVNQIAKHIESEFDDYKPAKTKGFDYSIYKSNVGYSSQKFHAAEKIYQDYRKRMQDCIALQNVIRIDSDEISEQRQMLLENLKQQLDEIIPDEITQTDILLDICYSKDYSAKTLVWAMCGDQIIKNLLKKNDNRIYIPMQNSSGDFEVKGKKFRMMEERID